MIEGFTTSKTLFPDDAQHTKFEWHGNKNKQAIFQYFTMDLNQQIRAIKTACTLRITTRKNKSAYLNMSEIHLSHSRNAIETTKQFYTICS